MSKHLLSAGDSHPGLVRKNNEDRFHLDPQRGVYLVVDGIGGQAAGEKAADVAVSMIRGRLERQTGTAEERIREAIAVANNEIFRLAHGNPEWQGMACVLTVAVVENGNATIGHVGDSRLYKIRRRRIDKVTRDHSPVGEREDSRELSEAEAMRHPRRNEVYRDVGSEPHTPDDPNFIDVVSVPFEPDSALLLCSDGLSDQVPSTEILRTVEQAAGDPGQAARELVAAANRAGGKDNVTVVIVEGERFRGPAETGSSPLVRRPAMFLYGFLLAAVLFAALQLRFGWLDTQRVPPPTLVRTLTVGTGQNFGTIQAALADARPGDTVEVMAGEYRESIRLKDGVNLKSRVPHAAILRATAAGGAEVAVTAENVKSGRFTGFRILADEKLPLALGVLIHDSDLEVDDVEIAGATAGIEIRGNSRPTVRANGIHDCLSSAVVVSGSAAPFLSHNSILRNGRKPRETRPAVVVLEPARPVLVGNIFADNGAEAVSLPKEMGGEPILKFNFFVNGRPFTPTAPGPVGGRPRGGRR